jgi:hypothetical protein
MTLAVEPAYTLMIFRVTTGVMPVVVLTEAIVSDAVRVWGPLTLSGIAAGCCIRIDS